MMLTLDLNQKSLLATVVLAIAFVQLVLMAFGRGWIGGSPPRVRRRLIKFHRFEGYVTFLIILWIAYNCVFNVGVSLGTARIVVHGLLGITVIGLVLSKISIAEGMRRYYERLPLLGFTLLGAVISIWVVSAGWYFFH